MTKVTFTLDDETVRVIGAIAARKKKPRSLVVREAVAAYARQEDKLDDAERARRLALLDDVMARPRTRPQGEVDKELREIRRARRAGWRRIGRLMLIHLDTSVLVDAFTGERRSLAGVRAATANGDVISFSTIVLYEWLRGPRIDSEKESVDAFFESDLPAFGRREAERAAELYGRVKGARQRQADLAIAACAIERGASLWTLNRSDFVDLPGLTLFGT